MKTKFIFISLFFIAFIVSSCQMSCGGFPEKYTGWTPYKEGNVLKFSDGITQYVFEIDSVFVTKPYKEDRTFESDCNARYYFCSKKNIYPFIEGFSTYHKNSTLGAVYTISLNENDIYNFFSFIYSIGKREYPDKSTILDTVSYKISNGTINNVLVIKNSTNPVLKYSLEKIFVHNGNGLLGFMDVNGKEYKLVE